MAVVRWQVFRNLLSDDSWSAEYDANGDGLSDGWTAIGTPTFSLDTTVKKHESHSQKAICTVENSGFYQDIDVSAATAYSFMCWYQVVSGTLSIKVESYDVGDNLLATSVTTTKTDATMTRYQTTFTTPASTTYVKIKFAQSGAVAATFYIDAVCLGLGSDLEVEVNPTTFTMRKGALVDFQRLTDGTLVKIKPSDVSTEIGEISSPLWVYISQAQKDSFDALVNERIIITTHLNEVYEFDLMGYETEFLQWASEDVQKYSMRLTLKSVLYPDS